jgi:tetraacyldisaccharide 4'-kinase
MPQAPEFWTRAGLLSDLMLPFSWAFAAGGTMRRRFAHPWRASVPVLCIGNLVAGGAGKTPVTLSLARLLHEAGKTPHILSRGYGGSCVGPLRVDPARHSAEDVGDEALLLAQAAPTWIGADRAQSAREAIAAGAELLLLDDGFQNPTLHQDFALAVIDGQYGLGNGRVIPAGPLREPAAEGLARAQAIVLIGADRTGIAARSNKPVLCARLQPREAEDLAGCKTVAFAGIGRPEKFFATLRQVGAELVSTHAFADHHAYREAELARLLDEASERRAVAITTEKDRIRLAQPWRARIRALKVEIQWEDEAAVMALLARLLSSQHG